MMRKSFLISLCFPLLVGCWDRREINDVAFVIATAVDKEGDLYRSTVQIPLPSQMGGAGSSGGGGGTSGSKKWYIESATGRTIRESNAKQQQATSRKLYFAHRRVALLGEELVKEGLEPLVDIFGRIPQNRLTAFPVVTRGKARELLSVDAPMEMFPAEMVRELTANATKNQMTMKDLVNVMLTEGIDPALPAVIKRKTSSGNKKNEKTTVGLDGLAVFNHENKLTGFLNREEAGGVLLALNQARVTEVSIFPQKGKKGIAVQILETNLRMHPTIQKGKVTIVIEGKVQGIIVENSTTITMVNSPHLQALKSLLDKKLDKKIEKGIAALQKAHSDVLGVGRSIYISNPKLWKQVKKDWPRMYPKIPVVVHVQADIEHGGTLISPLGVEREDIEK